MATVHFGRLLGNRLGFTRTVAIKRLHEQYANDPDCVAMLLDEARLAARIHHPNVVSTLDVVEDGGEVFLVMDYVAGVSVGTLMRQSDGIVPPEHAVGIMIGTLHGLHAAHEARNEAGESLAIVHRDVSPQNILVAEDGVARVIDFGIAKAIERSRSTRDNDLRGKLQYMAPERLQLGTPIDRRTDIYSASVVLWEMLTGRRYIDVDGAPPVRIQAVLTRKEEAPSAIHPSLPPALDAIVLRGLSRDPGQRYETADEMAAALERAFVPSSQREIGGWVTEVAGETLRERARELQRIETNDAVPQPQETSMTERVVVHVPVPEEPPPEVLAERQESARGPDYRPLALLGGASAVVLAFVVRGSFHDDPPRPAAQTEMEGTTEAPPVVSQLAVAPPVAEPEIVADAAAAPPVATVVKVAAPRPRPPPPTPVAPPPAPRPSARASCNPPYTVDHGIKVPKPECL
jgi:serine/threonine-protein kinase